MSKNSERPLTTTGLLSKEMNRKFKECLENYEIPVEIAGYHQGRYDTLEEYQSSFDDIEGWLKDYKGPMEFDVVVFHAKKGDGLFGAAIAWNYLLEKCGKKHEDILWRALGATRKPVGREIRLSDIENKNVLIIDLSFEKDQLEIMRNVAKTVVVIDDHPKLSEISPTTFVGENHSACAYTWKFFHPKEDVPMIIVAIDDSDRKLFSPFLGPLSSWISESIGYIYVHDERTPMRRKRNSGRILEDIWNIISENNINFWSYLGKYMRLSMENLRYQIASKAFKGNFLGYTVGIMNLDAPNLTKTIAQEIFNVFAERNEKIDFVVMYAYQGNNKVYHVSMIEKQIGQPKYNLKLLAEQLGKKGGHPKGGGGDRYVGSFYWPHDKKHDIWDLFNSKNIKNL